MPRLYLTRRSIMIKFGLYHLLVPNRSGVRASREIANKNSIEDVTKYEKTLESEPH